MKDEGARPAKDGWGASSFIFHLSSLFPMWTRQTFREHLGTHAVIGMVHLAPLPGAPLFEGSMQKVVDAAVRDARALQMSESWDYLLKFAGSALYQRVSM